MDALKKYRAMLRNAPPKAPKAPANPAPSAYKHGRILRGLYPFPIALDLHLWSATNKDAKAFTNGYYSDP